MRMNGINEQIVDGLQFDIDLCYADFWEVNVFIASSINLPSSHSCPTALSHRRRDALWKTHSYNV